MIEVTPRAPKVEAKTTEAGMTMDFEERIRAVHTGCTRFEAENMAAI